MFGIGVAEIAVVAFVGVLVFGPDKVPGLLRQVAEVARGLKKMSDSVRDDVRSQLGEEYADLELRDLHPRELVLRQVRDAMDDLDAEDESDEDDSDDDSDDDVYADRTIDTARAS